MQSQASNSFLGNMNVATSTHAAISGETLQPDMHPATLEFRQPKLERDYVQAMRRQTASVVRFGVLLVLLVFALFGTLDLVTASTPVGLSWPMRVAVFVITALLFGISFTPLFERHRESFMLPFCLLLGTGMTIVLTAIPDGDVDHYYAGYILIIVGAYTVLGLRFPNATLVSLILLGLYLTVEFLLHAHTGPRSLTNAAFVWSTLIIAAVGGYLYERQRRLAHYRLRVIEYERARSEYSALHDPLTGLPNRRLLTERMHQAMARDKRFHTYAAVLFIDLDNFKPVNDNYGHAFGDRLLKCVAERLQEVVRDTDTVTRVGGDEFVVLLEDLMGPECARLLKHRILHAFKAPFVIDGEELLVEMSVGCALDPVDARTPRELLAAADRAMYEMKKRRGRR